MPSTYTLYSQINSLEEFSMIAGTDYVLTFTCYQDDGVTLQDIGGASVMWSLCPYGNTDYTFSVTIPASSTENLSGKYLQQQTIDSFFGQRYRSSQGTILIIPRIPLN
jgi:hypothetical protein